MYIITHATYYNDTHYVMRIYNAVYIKIQIFVVNTVIHFVVK